MMEKCSVSSCRSSSLQTVNVTYHRLPVWDSALLKKWLTVLKLKEWNLSEPCFVCSLHFPPECFVGDILRDDAVPTATDDQLFQVSDEITVQPDYPLKDEPMENYECDTSLLVKLSETVCRICGGEYESHELHSIFDNENKILEKISECLPIIIQETDLLPLHICTVCMNEVDVSHRLIMKAVNTEIALLQCMNSTEEEDGDNEDDDIEVNLPPASDHNEKTMLPVYGPVKCDICGLQLADMSDLDNHVKLEKQRTVVKHSTNCVVNKVCSLCGKIYPGEEDYQEHKVDGPHNCDKCGKLLFTACDFNRHIIRQCSSELACPHCYLTFSSTEKLNGHITVHENEHPQQKEPITEYCRRCGGVFHNNFDLFHHICGTKNKRNHEMPKLTDVQKENEAKYNCEICGRHYKRLSNLVKHCSSHKSSAGSMYKCPVIQCDKSFEKPGMLTAHVDKVHNMGEVWVCRYCGKSMTTKLSLNIHERIHMGIKPYVCEWCGVEFRSKANLSQHQAKHTGIRRHSCPVCGKMFSRKAFVTTHLRVHTGERPYFCDICDQRFTQIGDMRRHRRRHIATDQNGNPVGTRTLHKRGIVPQARTLSNINAASDSAPAVLIFHQNDVQTMNQSQSYAVEQNTTADISSTYEIHGVLVQQ